MANLITIYRKSIKIKTIQIMLYLILNFNHIVSKIFKNIKDIIYINKSFIQSFNISLYQTL